MKMKDLAKAALSNDIICVVDDILRGKIVEKTEAAYRWIESEHAEREIDRFTMIPRTDGVKGKMIAVTLKA